MNGKLGALLAMMAASACPEDAMVNTPRLSELAVARDIEVPATSISLSLEACTPVRADVTPAR
jgi:hypothetical protein